jgi:glycosyltransferase involved in cell wall biosynthesis
VGKKAPIIFDEFVSPYDSFVNEHRKTSRNSLLASLLFRLEKSILENSDYLWTDTQSQAEYYAELFNIPENKFMAIPVAADETLFKPSTPPWKESDPEPFTVFTYATFLPLHGMEFILLAADQLKSLPIRFVIAGGKGKKLDAFLQLKQELGLDSVSHIPWIEYELLPAQINRADLCLGGPFGNTAQAQRVITGKTLQFMACGVATVVGINRESHQFSDHKNCLLVTQGDPTSLANAISWSYHHPAEIKKIGRLGRELYDQKFSIGALQKHTQSFFEGIGYD